MNPSFRIYIDRLRAGQTLEIEESFPADFIGVNDAELSFTGTVDVKGEAYLASDELVIRMDKISFIAVEPCAICNTLLQIPVTLQGLYWTHPLQEIKGAIYDFSEDLREQIVLDVPKLVECENSQGKRQCPRRKEIANYLKEDQEAPEEEQVKGHKKAQKNVAPDDHYFPFADLELK